MTNFKLAKLENVVVRNIKTGNCLLSNIECYENTRTGKMMFSGVGTSGKASWLASNCELEEKENYKLNIVVA